MKRSILLLTFILSLIFNEFYVIGQAKPITYECSDLSIEINPDVELFQIIALLAGNYNSMNDFEFDYKKRIDSYFSMHKNHQSVQFLKKVLNNCGAHTLLKGLIINSEFKKDTGVYKLISVQAWNLKNDFSNKVKVIDSLRTLVELFRKETNFTSFYNENKTYYKSKLDEVKKAINGIEIIKPLETFWGEKKDIYRIIIVLLERDLHSHWFTEAEKLNSIFYLPPKFLIGKDVYFGNSDHSNLKEGKMSAKDYIYYGAGHEFGHSFINNITVHHEHAINKLAFEIKTMDPTKTDFLNESILRSYTAFEFFKNGNAEVGNLLLMAAANNGYIHNKKIIELFKTYEGSREKYENFNDFMSEFIKKFLLRH